jgi:hypothetical protein
VDSTPSLQRQEHAAAIRPLHESVCLFEQALPGDRALATILGMLFPPLGPQPGQIVVVEADDVAVTALPAVVAIPMLDDRQSTQECHEMSND